MSGTLRFVTALEGLWRRGLDADAQAAATRLFVDGIAVAVLGASEPGPRMLAAMAVAEQSRPAASIIGTRHRVAPAAAARANGAAMHVLDYEPMWNPANHALSTTLPALLALAEGAGDLAGDGATVEMDGRGLLTALAIGIEAQARLRRASGQFEPAGLTFHPPGAVGPIGAAIACGLMLGLEPARLAHAAGIAASRSGGILANVGSMTKALHCGQAAASGLESALLAARGFTADADALFGPRGFGVAFFGHEPDAAELFADRPKLHVVDPGPAFKFYPSQYGTHFVITAALEAHGMLEEGEKIAAVRIISPPMPYVHRPAPASGLAGKFSFQYVAAVALLDGRVDVASFTDERRFAADVESLLAKTVVVPDPAREGRFDRMTLDVEVETAGGRMLQARCEGPPGIWGRPADPDLLAAKARDCLVAAFPPAEADALLGRLRGIADLDAGGVRALIEAMRPAAPVGSSQP